MRHLEPGRQLLLGNERRPSLAGTASTSLRAWHFQQTQEEHQQSYPKGVIPGHPQREVAADGGRAVPILFPNHLYPGLFATAGHTTQAHHPGAGAPARPAQRRQRRGHRLASQQRPQTQPCQGHDRQELTLPQQPMHRLPFRLTPQPGPPHPTTLPQPLHPRDQTHPHRPLLSTEIPQAPQQETAQERDGPGAGQIQPTDSTVSDPAAPQVPLPTASRSHYHHLGRPSDPACLTVRQAAHHGQDKDAEHHQGVETNPGQLNNREFCGILHESQPRDLYGMRVHCTLFRGLAQIHYGQT